MCNLASIMWLVCILATFAVLLGAGMGLSAKPRSGALRAIQAAGLGAGAVAVFAQLLPEAAEDVGLFALVPFATTLAFAGFLERLLHGGAKGVPSLAATRASLDLGVAAMAVHQALEGLAMAAVDMIERRHGSVLLARVGTLFALVAHTIPIVAVLTLALAQAVGRRAALVRVLVLAAVSGGGALLVASPTIERGLLASAGWIHGAVAGLLLHAVLHAALPLRHAAPGVGVRAHEVVGVLMGVALVVTAIIAHGPLPDSHFSANSLAVVGGGLLLAVVLQVAWPHPAHEDPLEATKLG